MRSPESIARIPRRTIGRAAAVDARVLTTPVLFKAPLLIEIVGLMGQTALERPRSANLEPMQEFGRVVDRHHASMPAIEGRGSLFRVVVERVDHRREIRDEGRRVLSGVLRLGQRVVGGEQQSLVETLVRLQHQRVIGRIDDVGDFDRVVDVRVRASVAVERKRAAALTVDEELDRRVGWIRFVSTNVGKCVPRL